ncbi:MAG: site-specific DNA-methyltransferase, partial [Gemmatimonadaceae bacterium]
DYIFTDPPFGSNIFYADCNLIGEAWLGTIADVELEAVVNRSRRVSQGGKTLRDYETLLAAAFSEMHRVLKPGRRATVVFQSSDGAVWNAIERAAHKAGFDLEGVDMLDKVQQSMKGYKGRSGAENVASFDIVLQLRRSVSNTRTRRSTTESQKALVLRTVGRHLAQQPEERAEERTLPFLYSLSIQALLNAGSDLASFSMDRLRGLLESAFEDRDGRWYSPSKFAAVG